MEQISQLDDEMKNQLISTKIDVKNLQDAHDYNINETQMKYENKINENINEHAAKEIKLVQTLEDQQKRIDYINERNYIYNEDKNRVKEEIKLAQLRKNESDEKIKQLEMQLINEREIKLKQEFGHLQKIKE